MSLKLKKKVIPAAFAASFVITLSMALGKYTHAAVFMNSSELTGAAAKLGQLFSWTLIIVPTYLLIKFLYLQFDNEGSQNRLLRASDDTSESEFKQLAKQSMARTAAKFFVCWLPYLLIRFPGNLDPDTLWQLMQTHGLALAANHHPWFDTLIFSLFWSIGDFVGNHSISIFVYAVTQLIATATSFALCIIYFEYLGLNRKFIKLSRVFFAAFPLIPMYAMTMTKDSLFSLLWIPYLISYYEVARTGGLVLKSPRFNILYMLQMLLLMLTKKTGIYVLLLSTLILIIFSIKRNRKQASICILVPFLLYAVVWEAMLLPAFNIAKGSSAEMMSLPSQQTAYYLINHSDEMTQEDWGVLEGVFTSPEQLIDCYVPGRADATKAHWKNNSSVSQKFNYFKWLILKAFQHPKTFLLALSANTLPAYYPDTKTEGDESLIFYLDNLKGSDTGDESLEQTLLSYRIDETITDTDIKTMMAGAYRYPLIHELSASFDSCLLTIMNLMAPLFSKCLYTWWLPLIAAFYAIHKKSKTIMIGLVPTFIALLTIYAGPIVLPRYVIPFVYSAPLTIMPMLDNAKNKTTNDSRNSTQEKED